MTTPPQPSDLEFAALIASKICHDVVGPVGAIYNGLEILAEDDDASSRTDALAVIQSVTQQASARLQFARFAFGAAGSAGAQIELDTARQISIGLFGDGKLKLHWNAAPGTLPKNQVKLLLNLIACATSALPRGGDVTVDVETAPSLTFKLLCSGRNARSPQYLGEFIAGSAAIEVDALSIQAYYTRRLADETKMQLSVEPIGEDIALIARG